jgi:hypothetical protein
VVTVVSQEPAVFIFRVKDTDFSDTLVTSYQSIQLCYNEDAETSPMYRPPPQPVRAVTHLPSNILPYITFRPSYHALHMNVGTDNLVMISASEKQFHLLLTKTRKNLRHERSGHDLFHWRAARTFDMGYNAM